MVLVAMLSTYFVFAVVLVAMIYANRRLRDDAVESCSQVDPGIGTSLRTQGHCCFLCNAPLHTADAATPEGVVRALERRIVAERSSIDRILGQASQLDLRMLYLSGIDDANGIRH